MTQSEHDDRRNRPNDDERLQTTTDLPDKAAGLQRQAETVVLGDAIAELAARIQAATYELLVMIHQFDERGGCRRSERNQAIRSGVGSYAGSSSTSVASCLKLGLRLIGLVASADAAEAHEHQEKRQEEGLASESPVEAFS